MAAERTAIHGGRSDWLLCRVISLEGKLPGKKTSGADGVTYESTKKNTNKFAPILLIIYNICLHFQWLPPEWKHGIITLVPKGNSSNCDINNIEVWRSISLLLSSYKILMKLILSWHLLWVVYSQWLTPCQKGSMPRNGSQEHVFTLKTAVSDYVHTSGKGLC